MATEAELAGADSAAVAAARDLVVAYLTDRYPDASVRAGQMSDLIVLPAADALAAVDARGAAVVNSSDPETALATGDYDESILDAVLAGRGVTRLPAATAAGTIAIHLSTVTSSVSVPGRYTVSTPDGTTYATGNGYRVLPPGSTAVSAAEVVAVTVPGGGFAVVVPVTATAAGAAGNRSAGTALTAAQPLAQQTAVYVASDLTGGADAETDAALLARLPAATAPRTVASAAGAASVVQEVYPYSGVAVIGFGHAGMRRGRTSLVGQAPGRVDVRVRTSDAPSRVRVRVTATLISKTPFGRWRYVLAVDDAPGRYLVEKTIQADAALTVVGYAVATATPGFDISGAGAPVDIRVSSDAVLSAYSTLSVEFVDQDTPTGGLTINVSTRSYDAIVRTVPALDLAQIAVEGADVRAVGGDCLVRAAVSVRVALTAVAGVPSGVTLTAATVASAVSRSVNGNGIGQVISAAAVAARAAPFLPSGTALQLTGWTGSVYPVSSNSYTVSGSTGLSVTTDWSVGVGPDAVAFYADPEDVTASVTTLT